MLLPIILTLLQFTPKSAYNRYLLDLQYTEPVKQCFVFSVYHKWPPDNLIVKMCGNKRLQQQKSYLSPMETTARSCRWNKPQPTRNQKLETVKQACQNTGPNVHNVPLGRSTINRNPGGRTVQFSDSFLRVWFQLLRICSRKPYFQSNLYFLPSINTLH